MTADHPTAKRGSSGSAISNIHPTYRCCARRTQLWRELEADSGRKLLTITGIVEIGAPDGELVRGTLASSRLHGLPHDVLNAAELMQRFPAFAVPAITSASISQTADFSRRNRLIHAHDRPAQSLRARKFAPTHRCERSNRAATACASSLRAATSMPARSSLPRGHGSQRCCRNYALPLRVTRQVLGWLSPRSPAQFTPDKFPVFLFESRHGIHYGFPIHGEQRTENRQASSPRRNGRSGHLRPQHFSRATKPQFSRFATTICRRPTDRSPRPQTCLYTMTPDGDFIIDRLPDAPQIIVASPCSGHGFKFAPVIGDIVADLAINGATQRDISRFPAVPVWPETSSPHPRIFCRSPLSQPAAHR